MEKENGKREMMYMYTSRDVVEGNAGTGECLLNRSGDSGGVTIGGDGNRSAVILVDQR